MQRRSLAKARVRVSDFHTLLKLKYIYKECYRMTEEDNKRMDGPTDPQPDIKSCLSPASRGPQATPSAGPLVRQRPVLRVAIGSVEGNRHAVVGRGDLGCRVLIAGTNERLL